MRLGILGRVTGALALALVSIAPVQARDGALEAQFDSAFGTQVRAPRDFTASVTSTPVFHTALEQQLAQLAAGNNGRIGVAALDLTTGEEVAILGNQRFPMASTSKIAIAATFMAGVDQGRWTLDSEFPLRVPVPSKPFSSAVAPTRPGQYLRASQLLDLMLTRSSNTAADALLSAVGGPNAVDAWVHNAGVMEFNLTHDIATLVRDDGAINPAYQISVNDSATPRAMVQLVSGIYQGKWLAPASRTVIVSIMKRCRTGAHRLKALLPADATVAHKTGTLNNTASDVGIIATPDGHQIAIAIYVTGNGGHAGRDAKIASLSRAIFDGYLQNSPSRQYASATYPAPQQVQ